MGIPGFSSWLKRRYPEAFIAFPDGHTVDHMYIDLPSTLHIVTRKARTKTYFHQQLHKRLDELLLATSPTRRIVLALDGPAPLAKLLEQRRRRRREADRALRSHKKSSNSAISSLSITTGTILMLEIHQSLAYYICERLADPRFQHLEFELSDSTVKGEGELKILSRLLHEPSTGAVTDGTHLVIGGDSDLLLMATISGKPGVFIAPDGPDQGLTDGTAIAFSRDALEEVWRRDHLAPGATAADVTGMALDLTLLAIMSSGNDYLPACQGLQLNNKHRDGLWSMYLEMKKMPEWQGRTLVNRTCTICDGTEDGSSCDSGGPAVAIDRMMLAGLLQLYYSSRYVSMSTTKPSSSSSISSVSSVDGSMDSTLEGSWDVAGGGPVASAKERDAASQNSLGRFPADPAEYIKGLEWVLSMYSTGAVQDYRWTYLGIAPSVPIFIDYLMGNDAGGVGSEQQQQGPAGATEVQSGFSSGEESDGNDVTAVAQRQQKQNRNLPPLVPAACALALLPARGRQHAATALRHLMDADSPVAEIYAVCKECQRLGNELSAVSREFDKLRLELQGLQGELATSPLDSDGPIVVEEHLLGAVERCEAAQTRLKALLQELSRSQQEHLSLMHPPTPFPTAELEAAVRSVPIERYPRRERRLARFGREMVFKWKEGGLNGSPATAFGGSIDVKDVMTTASPLARTTNEAAGAPGAGIETTTTTSNDDEGTAAPALVRPNPRDPNAGDNTYTHRAGGPDIPNWVHELIGFANAYPRVADAMLMRKSVVHGGVVREVLPLQPYMQPPKRTSRYQQGFGGTGGVGANRPPMAIALACQLRKFGGGAAPAGGAVLRMPGLWGRSYYHAAAPAALHHYSHGVGVHAVGGGVGWQRPMVQRALTKCMSLLPRLRALKF